MKLENLLQSNEAVANVYTTEMSIFNVGAVSKQIIVDADMPLEEQDIAACLENTLNRMLDEELSDEDIYYMTGITVESSMHYGEPYVEIDRGYILPGEILQVEIAEYSLEDPDIEVSVDITGKDEDYWTGTVEVEDFRGNRGTCAFEYRVETGDVELRKYSAPGWLTGSSYETELPKVALDNIVSICDAVFEEVDREMSGQEFEGASVSDAYLLGINDKGFEKLYVLNEADVKTRLDEYNADIKVSDIGRNEWTDTELGKASRTLYVKHCADEVEFREFIAGNFTDAAASEDPEIHNNWEFIVSESSPEYAGYFAEEQSLDDIVEDAEHKASEQNAERPAVSKDEPEL